MAAQAREHRPKVIVVGATAYPRVYDFARAAEIAESVDAVLVVDMAHVAGLVAGGVHRVAGAVRAGDHDDDA